MKLYSVIIFVPIANADAMRAAIAAAGAGRIGQYDSCSFSTTGTGRFRPLEAANPHIGSVGTLEEVEEERIEVAVSGDTLAAVLGAAKKAHPYEEPAIHILPMEDYKQILDR